MSDAADYAAGSARVAPETDSDSFFAGFIAAIALIGSKRLMGSRIALNRAFWQAVKGPEGQFVDLRDLAIDFDPLYGVSPWFERALTRAQRDLLVSFPNPTYQAVEIKLNSDQANQVLDLTGNRERFMALAEAFTANMVTER